MIAKLLAPAVLALALAALAPAAAAQDSGDDPLVATVNGEQIFRSEVLETAKTLPPQYQAQLDQIFPALVERVVDFRLLAAAAEAANLAEDAEVVSRMAELRRNVVREVYLERAVEVRITDEALKGQYQAYLEANPPEPEVSARHILLEEEAEAKEAIVALDGGADFADLARERSTGPSGPKGGDLGFFTKEQMVPEFAEVAFAMEPGSHSKEPVQTQFGWHVIKVEDRRAAAPPALEELRADIFNELAQAVIADGIVELREGVAIERFAFDGSEVAPPEAPTAPAEPAKSE